MRWTESGDVSGFDLVLPLIVWGYHSRFAEWHALLDRLEASGLSVVNPVPLLRWNSDKSYLTELGTPRRADGRDAADRSH